jgi:hypothetical protein
MGKRKGPGDKEMNAKATRPETGWDKTLEVFRESYQPGNRDNRTRTTRKIMYPRVPRAGAHKERAGLWRATD